MKTLLDKTREINKIIQKAAGHPISFAEMADTLCKNIDANVYIIGHKGKVLGSIFLTDFSCIPAEDVIKTGSFFPEKINDALLRITETNVNVECADQCIFDAGAFCSLKDKFSTFVPIVGGGQRLGTLLFTKNAPFDGNDILLAEYGATVIGMEILRAKVEKVEEITRQKAVVSIAFDTLSYSELEAVDHIFKELGDSNGLLVASKIADRAGITRSVIVNALRKLESAGVIEVRSLGMKGTYIRILNEYLLEELDRLQSTHRA